MISTILNELSVQIVSDPFPKPKQCSHLIRFHQCQSPCTNQFQVKSNKHFVLPFSDFNHRAQNKYKSNRQFVSSFLSKPAFKQTQIQIQQAICSFLFIQACLQANTNTNPTGILFLPFYPSLPSSKHKANNNHSKHRANQSKANKNKHTSRSSLAGEEVAQQGSPPRRESVPDPCACLQDQTCQRQQRHQRRRDGSHQERV